MNYVLTATDRPILMHFASIDPESLIYDKFLDVTGLCFICVPAKSVCAEPSRFLNIASLHSFTPFEQINAQEFHIHGIIPKQSCF